MPFKGASIPSSTALLARGPCRFCRPFRLFPPSSEFSRLRPELLSLYSYISRSRDNLLSSTMIHPLQQYLTTPHITPHIHHTKYAHSPENDTPNQCMFVSFCTLLFTLHRIRTVLGRDLEHLSEAGFDMEKIHLKRNAPPAQLYEDDVRNEGAVISSSGALINFSGKKTGRSPKDKRIVYEDSCKDDVWWGSVNIKMDERMYF